MHTQFRDTQEIRATIDARLLKIMVDVVKAPFMRDYSLSSKSDKEHNGEENELKAADTYETRASTAPFAFIVPEHYFPFCFHFLHCGGERSEAPPHSRRGLNDCPFNYVFATSCKRRLPSLKGHIKSFWAMPTLRFQFI